MSTESGSWGHIRVLTPLFNNSIPILLHIALSLATAPFLSILETDGKAWLKEIAKNVASKTQ